MVGVSGETPPEHILRILAGVRYQARLTTSSITLSVNMVKQKNYKSVVGYLRTRMWGPSSVVWCFCFRGSNSGGSTVGEFTAEVCWRGARE